MMKTRNHLIVLVLFTLVVCGFTLTAVAQTGTEKSNLYLVVGSEGPGFTSPQEAIQVLEKGILPTFDALLKLQEEKKIIAGGLPIGDRALVMVVKASSNQEVDKMLRSLPAWGALKWKVTALESIAGRAAQEREILGQLKKMIAK
jgi:ABC-type oligopeptide transport system substrate-binding subunit